MSRDDSAEPRGFGLTTFRDPIEKGFGDFGRFVHRRAWWVIVGVVVCSAALFTQLPQLGIDTSTEGFLPDDNPLRVAYEDFRDRYGRDQAILIAVEGDDVFDLAFLEKLRALHEELESELPHLQDVQSLLDTRNTRGEGDQLVVEDLLEDWPESEADLALLRERVRSSRLYVDQLISRDERMTTLIVKPDVYSPMGQATDALAGFEDEAAVPGEKPVYLTGEENSEVVEAVRVIVERHRDADFRILVAGVPVMVHRLMTGMLTDMGRFTALSILTIAFFLALLFRRVAAVILPLVVSGFAMLSTLSLMAMMGIQIATTTQIIPSFLLAVGVGGAVHILAIFYQASARGESREDSIAYALQHSGLAVAMTSFTTAGGMLSFVSSGIAPVAELGIMAPIGVMMALLFCLVLLPALIAVFPMKASEQVDPEHVSPARSFLMACGDMATVHAWPVVGAWALLLVLSVVGATRIELSHDPVRWFPEQDPMRIAMETIDERLNGTMFVEVVVDTGVENGIQSPQLLDRIERFQDFALGLEGEEIRVGKTISITDVVKETHQALNENRPEFYAIPRDRELVAQELLLFENSGSDDLEELVDSQFSETRVTLKMPFSNMIHYAGFFDRLAEEAEEIFGAAATLTFTGESRMMSWLVSTLSINLMKTYVLAFSIITPLMILLLGSVRTGLVSMIPNLTPVIVTLGVMGWFGIPLEVFTMLIGSIALGLAVDDTVHFMHNFRRYFEWSGDVRFAVRETLATTGQALLFTTVVLSSGFFIFMFATMKSLHHFGMLTGITIVVAFLADLLLAPALMSLLARFVTRPVIAVGEAEAA
ncbi:MAG: MMPL family transporter [Deltaproteobacteria bacterium]|nr:MMPL family transporter [Deltaproteobacteria bacterium]